jgi:hypothetical protein
MTTLPSLGALLLNMCDDAIAWRETKAREAVAPLVASGDEGFWCRDCAASPTPCPDHEASFGRANHHARRADEYREARLLIAAEVTPALKAVKA